MIKTLAYVLLILPLIAFSQHSISGLVIDPYGARLPDATIIEDGTENNTKADLDGRFSLVSTQDSCSLTIAWLGYESQIIPITQDTFVLVTLSIFNYKSKWLTIGAGYDVLNSTTNLFISNGLDENALIHFEDFNESWMYKASGSFNLNKDYSWRTKLARDIYSKYLATPAIEFRQIHFAYRDFILSDVNLSAGLAIRPIHQLLLIKTGFQRLNTKNHFGAALGTRLYIQHLPAYYGFMVGYWPPYWTWHAWLQGFILDYRLAFRAEYERIDRFDFLRIGIHCIFRRR